MWRRSDQNVSEQAQRTWRWYFFNSTKLFTFFLIRVAKAHSDFFDKKPKIAQNFNKLCFNNMFLADYYSTPYT